MIIPPDDGEVDSDDRDEGDGHEDLHHQPALITVHHNSVNHLELLQTRDMTDCDGIHNLVCGGSVLPDR